MFPRGHTANSVEPPADTLTVHHGPAKLACAKSGVSRRIRTHRRTGADPQTLHTKRMQYGQLCGECQIRGRAGFNAIVDIHSSGLVNE